MTGSGTRRLGFRFLRRIYISSDWVPYLVLGVIGTVVVATAYGGPYVIQFVDEVYPWNYFHALPAYSYAWNPVNSGSYTAINVFGLPTDLVYLPFAAVSAPPWVAQLSVNALAMVFSGVGIFLLSRRFFVDQSGFVPVVASLGGSVFYMLNIVGPEILYWDFIPIGPILAAVLPFQILLILTCFDQLNSTGRTPWRRVLVVGLISPFTIGANVPLGVSAAILILFVLVWRTLARSWRQVGKRLILVTMIVGAITLANLFWIVPEIQLIASASLNSTASGAYASNLQDFFSYTSRLSFLNVLELRNLQQNLLTSYSPLFNGPSSYSLLFLPFLLVCAVPLLWSRRLAPKRRAATLALWLALLCTAFLSLGINAPLYGGGLSEVFTNPILIEIFRNTGNSFALAIALLEALLFAQGLQDLTAILNEYLPASSGRSTLGEVSSSRSRHTSRVQTSVAIVAVAVICLTPVILPAASGNLIPRNPYEDRVEVPAFIQSIANYVNSNAGSWYTMLVPGGFQEQNFSNSGGRGYLGQDLLASMIVTPVIFDEGGGLAGQVNPLTQLAYADIESGSSGNAGISDLLSLLQVRFIVLESGLGEHYPWGITVQDNFSRMVSFMDSQLNVTPVGNFSPYALYENLGALPPSVVSPSRAGGYDGSVVNLTSIYLNATDAFAPDSLASPIQLVRNDSGFNLEANVSRQGLGFSPPGYAVAFNSIPLNVSLAVYPYLSVTFETNRYTATMFEVSGVEALNVSSVSEDLEGTWQVATPLSNCVPNVGWYYSNGSLMTVVINAAALLLNADGESSVNSLGLLNFLSISLFPTEGNNIEQLHTNASNSRDLWTHVASITASSPFFFQANSTVRPRSSMTSSVNLVPKLLTSNPEGQTGLTPPINATPWEFGFNVSYNSTSEPTLSYPGYPIFFNSEPLGVDLLTYGCLSISFETDPGTLVSFGLSGNLTLSEAGFSGEWEHVGQLAIPESASGIYSSVGTTETLDISLQQLLLGSSTPDGISALNYLYVQIVGGPGGGPFYKVSITNVTLSSYCFFSEGVAQSTARVLGNFLAPPSIVGAPFNPFTDLELNASTNPANLAPTNITDVDHPNPSTWSLNLKTEPGEVGLVLFQNFAPGWQLTASVSGVSSVHIEVDGFANGWILTVPTGVSEFQVRLFYSPQLVLTDSLSATAVFVVWSAMTLLVTVAIARRRRMAVGDDPNAQRIQ